MNNNLGLKKGTVSIVPFGTEFKRYYIEKEEKINKILSGLTYYIEHIGSTSISNFEGKPIIDIVIGIDDIQQVEIYTRKLEKIGYISHGFLKGAGGHILSLSNNDKTTCLIHIVRYNSFKWKKYLTFRDYLNCHGQKRDSYLHEKKRLSKLYGNNREMYTKNKRSFIIKLEKESLKWNRLRYKDLQ
ncbi:hypothetical protein BC455_15005 [Vibrio harveyi]|uniref:GrpB family protein n=1 Tax=Vibrio harveyi TaxID=669 RepID=UPI0008419F9C|nr:GrpB family protein [Vibrio harveyi]ODM58052.1 hypothetical protein BC455_15005 [Vibrio harveyi]